MLKLLLAFLLKEKNRERVKDYLFSLNLEYPYSDIIKLLYSVKGDLTKKDLLVLLRENKLKYIATQLHDIPTTISPSVAFQAIEELQSLQTLNKITNILKLQDTPQSKLQKISSLNLNPTYIESKAKRLRDLKVTKEDKSILSFIYPLHKGELCILAGYTGIGKTHASLTLIKQALQNTLECLYISIADWTETTFKSLIASGNFSDFWVAIYSDCTLPQVELEIEQTKPDFVVVDTLTVLNTIPFPTDKRYLQLGWITQQLKAIAQRQNVLILATHQLTNQTLYPTEEDLQDSKSHLLSPVDVCLALGGHPNKSERYLTTIKVRRYPVQSMKKLYLDYKNFAMEVLE